MIWPKERAETKALPFAMSRQDYEDLVRGPARLKGRKRQVYLRVVLDGSGCGDLRYLCLLSACGYLLRVGVGLVLERM